MAKRLNKEEEISILIKNLLFFYYSHMFSNYYPNFKAFAIYKKEIKDAIDSEVIKIEESKFR